MTEQGDTCKAWEGTMVPNRANDDAVIGILKEAITPAVDPTDEKAMRIRAEVNTMLEAYDAPRVIPRWKAVKALGEKGIAPTTAIERIRSLHRRGLLEMGPAPTIYREKWGMQFKGVCVWFDEGQMAVRQERICQADLDPKWVDVRRVLQAQCNGEPNAKSFLAILRLCRESNPNLSHGGLQRFIKRRTLDGMMAHGPAGYYVVPNESPQPIEID